MYETQQSQQASWFKKNLKLIVAGVAVLLLGAFIFLGSETGKKLTGIDLRSLFSFADFWEDPSKTQGYLKICKVAGPGVPLYSEYFFDVYDESKNLITTTRVLAGPQQENAPGFCNFAEGPLKNPIPDGHGQFRVGSNVMVVERGVNNVYTSQIRSSSGFAQTSGTNPNLAERYAIVPIVFEFVEVEFTNTTTPVVTPTPTATPTPNTTPTPTSVTPTPTIVPTVIPTKPTVTVRKVVVNDNGGRATIKDFELFVSGQPVTSGISIEVNPGFHTVTERQGIGFVGNVKYNASFSGDCNAQGIIDVGRQSGNYVCYITNDDEALVNPTPTPTSVTPTPTVINLTPTPTANPTPTSPTPTLPNTGSSYVTVIKQVINDNGGTAQVSDFQLFVNGFRITSGNTIALGAGLKTVTETNLPGYTASFSGDCNAQGQFTTEVNRTYTCTITNNDTGLTPTSTPTPTSITPTPTVINPTPTPTITVTSTPSNTPTNPTPTSIPGNLSITKEVRNETKGTLYGKLSQASTGDRLSFKILVTNNGARSVSSIILRDELPNGLSLDSNSILVGGNSVSGINPISINNLAPSQSTLITFSVNVSPNSASNMCNTARVSGSGVGERSDYACVQVVGTSVVGAPNIVISKSASKNFGAGTTSITAARGDVITYILTTKNTGNADAINYTISDDLSQVLPLANLADNGGGNLVGSVLTFPSVTIKPNETVTKTFALRIKEDLATTVSYQMQNIYGNNVVVNIPGSIQYIAPKSGVDQLSPIAKAIAFALIFLLTVVWFKNPAAPFKFIKEKLSHVKFGEIKTAAPALVIMVVIAAAGSVFATIAPTSIDSFFNKKDTKQIEEVNPENLSIPSSAGTLVQGFSENPEAVWLIHKENGITVRSVFPNKDVFASYGLRDSKIQKASSVDALLPIGNDMQFAPGTLVRDVNNHNAFYVVGHGSSLKGFSSYQVFAEMGYHEKMAFTADLGNYSLVDNIDKIEAHAPGSDLLDVSTGEIYYLENESSRLKFGSQDNFNEWHIQDNDLSKVLPINEFDKLIPLLDETPDRFKAFTK